MNIPTSRLRTTLSCAILIAASAISRAESSSDPATAMMNGREPQVILYERPHFQGAAIVVQAGDSLYNLGSMRFPNGHKANDRIASILVEPGAEVVVYTDAKYEGEALHLRRSAENLAEMRIGSGRHWGNAISSLEASFAPRRHERGPGHPDNEPRIILYRDANFRGDFLEVYPGEEFRNLNKQAFENGRRANDAISSIRVIGPVRATLGADADFGRDVIEITEDLPNLARLPRSMDGRSSWDNAISSLRVEMAGPDDRRGDRRNDRRDRRGDRDNPPREDPAATIRIAYRELLDRDCTTVEVDLYVRRITRERWTVDMVRADIQRSHEYRQRQADTIIFAAYRDLLRREPDPEGLAHYRRMILEKRWSEDQLRRDIRSSPEFRSRSGGKPQPRPDHPNNPR